MLKEEVIEAVKEGKFSIYPIEQVDEGLEIITGMSVGILKEDGTYPEGTVNYLVVKRLTEIGEAMEKKKEKEEGKEEEKKQERREEDKEQK